MFAHPSCCKCPMPILQFASASLKKIQNRTVRFCYCTFLCVSDMSHASKEASPHSFHQRTKTETPLVGSADAQETHWQPTQRQSYSLSYITLEDNDVWKDA